LVLLPKTWRYFPKFIIFAVGFLAKYLLKNKCPAAHLPRAKPEQIKTGQWKKLYINAILFIDKIKNL